MVVGAWYGVQRSGACVQRSGACGPRPYRGGVLALAGALSALVPALVMWGFTVDDALIPLRYAHHLASGDGYRFNAHGPSTDGVTPLLWAPLLVPLARGGGSLDLIAALERVKVLGLLVWTVAGAALGHALAKRATGHRRATLSAVGALGIVALAFPIGAWAVSGLETGVATALATLAAVSFERPLRAALLAGLAACFRPELVVWAIAVAGGSVIARSREAGTPSALSHGLVYASAASVVVLTPILAFAPLALRRASDLSKTLALAGLTHIIVVIAVGGDWMPYARLMVPVAPSLAFVFVDVARTAHVASTVTRALAALSIGVLVAVTAAPAGRHVHDDRKELIARARPLLSSSRMVAALDVGWVGAATDAEIVDLAGLTDPAIASLRGGHTSKAVDVAMLLDRDVDAIVFYSQPRAVELRIMRSELFTRRFEHASEVALGKLGASYVIYRRR